MSVAGIAAAVGAAVEKSRGSGEGVRGETFAPVFGIAGGFMMADQTVVSRHSGSGIEAAPEALHPFAHPEQNGGRRIISADITA